MVTDDSANASKLIGFTRHLVTACISETGRLKFDKEHPQQLYSVCTYASLIELASGIDLLAAQKVMNVTCIPIVLRSFLEAFATFRCCIEDPNYFKTMYASFLAEKMRLLKSTVKDPEDPYLAKIAGAVDPETEMAKLAAELEKLKEQGYLALKTGEIFALAQMVSEYRSIYWQLCLHAHNNISAIEERHLEKNGENHGVALFKPEDPADLVRYFDSLCGMLLNASILLHKKFQTGREAVFEELSQALVEIRQAYVPSRP